MTPELNKWYVRVGSDTTWYFRPIHYLSENRHKNEMCYAEVIMIGINKKPRHYFNNFFMEDKCGSSPIAYRTIEDLKVALL